MARDDDGDSLWFTIVEGNPENVFYIAPDKGSVLLAKDLRTSDHSDAFNLTIRVSDGELWTDTHLWVSVIREDDTMVEFASANMEVSVPENVSVSTKIFTVKVTGVAHRPIFSLVCSQGKLDIATRCSKVGTCMLKLALP